MKSVLSCFLLLWKYTRVLISVSDSSQRQFKIKLSVCSAALLTHNETIPWSLSVMHVLQLS